MFRRRSINNTGSPRLAVLAALLALGLQLLAPVIPPSAMAQSMATLAATPQEAESFAATCLGIGRPDLGQENPAGHQAKCPICLSVAQGQGMAPVSAPLAVAFAWERVAPDFALHLAPTRITISAFASRAPPLA